MIFYVEDDQEIKNMIIYTLESSGFKSEGFSNGTELFDALKSNLPDLIMLDIMLPGDNGLEILRKLKLDVRTKNIPVIMSTAKGTEYDKVIGLEIGADDYLVKPFGLMEMAARIKALLRRTKAGLKNNGILKNGKIVLDDIRHIILLDEHFIELTLKEYELLRLFLENLDHVFTREVLLDRIWGMNYLGESRTVDVHVGTLRTKLGSQGELIETIRGVGYKMVRNYEEKNI